MWSIVEVARMSGVTARTLRHYDALGLLPPAGTAANGYREYGQAQLLRLQRILVLRALGLPLAEIGAVLDEQRDPVAALREHHRRLVAERDRLGRMADTVARTIEDLAAERSHMTPQNLFEGFDPTRYEQEARERWPEEAASSRAYVDTLTADGQRGLQEAWTARLVRFAALRASGEPVDAAPVQAAVHVHELYEGILPMWTPDAAAFRGLGVMYVEDARFAATFDRVAPGLAGYVRDAMAVYADAGLVDPSAPIAG